MYIEVQSMKNRILERKLGFLQRLLVQENVSGKTVESMSSMCLVRVQKAGEGLWSGVYRKDVDRRFDMKHIDEVEKMVT